MDIAAAPLYGGIVFFDYPRRVAVPSPFISAIFREWIFNWFIVKKLAGLYN
jgi:hypothetical protein